MEGTQMVSLSRIGRCGTLLVFPIFVVIVAVAFSTASEKTKQRCYQVCQPQRPASEIWRAEISRFFQITQGLIREIEAVPKPEKLAEIDQIEFTAKILLLGETRSKAAIPILLRNLTFLPSRHPDEDDGDRSPRTYEFFPAAVALARIGQPAIPALKEIVATAPRNALERRIALWIMLEMEANPDGGRVEITIEEPTKQIVWQRIELSSPNWKQDAVKEANDFIFDFKDTWERPKF